jgi:hypothetical protein
VYPKNHQTKYSWIYQLMVSHMAALANIDSTTNLLVVSPQWQPSVAANQLMPDTRKTQINVKWFILLSVCLSTSPGFVKICCSISSLCQPSTTIVLSLAKFHFFIYKNFNQKSYFPQHSSTNSNETK